MWPKFQDFMEAYGRRYASSAEALQRFQNFKDFLVKVDERNAKGGATHGVTKFADLTPEDEMEPEGVACSMAPCHVSHDEVKHAYRPRASN